MEREIILNFENQRVKLTFSNGFNLIGTILEVYQESILFKTEQKTAALNIHDIKEIVGGF